MNTLSQKLRRRLSPGPGAVLFALGLYLPAGPLGRPPLHGEAGVWDEIVFALGFVLSIIIFIALALTDKKREKKEERPHEEDI